MKKIYAKTYGCQMNVYDTDRMLEILSNEGFEETKNLQESDAVLLNTCHIRGKAAEKLYSDIGRIKKISDKTSKKKKTLIVSGCVAQAEGKEITRRSPFVDLVVGPQSYHKLPNLIQSLKSNKRIVDTDFPVESKFDHLINQKNKIRKSSAFLTIQEGCDKFCTFCVVPYTRGSEYSRPVSDIINEAIILIDDGVKEITLLGQNVNAYHGIDASGKIYSLGELLFKLAKLNGLKRLRYTTNHPRDVDDIMISAHKDIDILMPYLHLPIQSGSNKILKSMNRGHTSADYLKIIEKVRKARPDIAISSDFIIGFPGEEEKDFKDTYKLIDTVQYSQAYSFAYSERPGTPAATMDNQLSNEIKMERLHEVQELIKSQQRLFNGNMVGRTMEVLADRLGKDKKQIIGRSPYLQSVHFDGPKEIIGKIINIKIISSNTNSLAGEVV